MPFISHQSPSTSFQADFLPQTAQFLDYAPPHCPTSSFPRSLAGIAESIMIALCVCLSHSILKGPILDVIIICSEAYGVNVTDHRGAAEEWSRECPRKSCWNGMRSSLVLLALSPRQGQHKGTGNKSFYFLLRNQTLGSNPEPLSTEVSFCKKQM